MVTIIDAVERNNSKGETFTSLILTGGIEFTKNKQGKHYATYRKASLPSTLTLAMAKSLIGTKMPGCIKKVPSEPYLFKTHTGEEIEISFSYEYSEEGETLAEAVFS